jgi:hypothetical protein
MRQINDWRLAEELGMGRSVLVVGFVSRRDRSHRDFLEELSVISEGLDGAEFRFLDLAEHPSLAESFGPGKLPLLLVFVSGAEKRRWRGRVERSTIVPALQEIIDAHAHP